MASDNCESIASSCRSYDSSISSSFQYTKSVIENQHEIPFIDSMTYAYRYEREFVKIICEIAASQGINDAQLARLAWPHQKGAATAWRKMRNDEEKPKRLTIEEAVLLTQALNISMSDVCGMVQGKMLGIQQMEKCFSPGPKTVSGPELTSVGENVSANASTD